MNEWRLRKDGGGANGNRVDCAGSGYRVLGDDSRWCAAKDGAAGRQDFGTDQPAMNEPIITFTLPPMPDANDQIRIYRSGKTGWAARVAGEHRQQGYLTGINALATLDMEKPMLKRARIVLTNYPADMKKDTVNLWSKNHLDGFQDAGIFANDKGIEELTIRFGGVDKDDPRVDVEIYEVTE